MIEWLTIVIVIAAITTFVFTLGVVFGWAMRGHEVRSEMEIDRIRQWFKEKTK